MQLTFWTGFQVLALSVIDRLRIEKTAVQRMQKAQS